MIRFPIITMLGHVDSGKTSLLDKIRETFVGKHEAEHITQHIGASEIPIERIKKICGSLFESLKNKITIPGILTIDTPGHEAFTSLRERGGSIADIAVLVIDVNAGVQPQTKEAIEILKAFKVPFIIAANKIDLVPFWKSFNETSFLKSLEKQASKAKEELYNRIYNIMGDLSNLGFSSNMFNLVNDYTKEVAIIPVSAETGEGLSELLMVLTGLTQKYLEENLKLDVKGNGKGSVLEIKNSVGLGKTLDVILYDGVLQVNDYLVLVGRNGLIRTKIKALLKPAPLEEIREKKTKFKRVKKIVAAAGIKIVAPNLEEVLPGMPFEATRNEKELSIIEERLKKNIAKIKFETENKGITLKADTLGSLEALIKLFKNKNIPVSKADIGSVNKKDVMHAKTNKEKDEFLGVIFAFNVKINKTIEEFASQEKIKIIKSNVIYRLLEEYEEWKEKMILERKESELKKTVLPVKIKILPGFLFRQSKPCIVGVEVLEGNLKTNYELINKENVVVGKALNIQENGKSIKKATKGSRVALSIDNAVFGKTINENEILYSNISEKDYEILKTKLKFFLKEEEKEVMREILKIKQKKNPFWGNK